MTVTIKDFATGKELRLTPEEQVRQDFEKILHNDYHYPKGCMDIEVPIQIGVKKVRADIAIYESVKKRKIIGIVETKSPKAKEGSGQLKSYMSATPTCRWGVFTDGNERSEIYKRDLKTGSVVSSFGYSVPLFGESEIFIRSYKNLRPASNLKWIFRLINNSLYANANLARTEKQGAEMVRLIFCKMHDESKADRKGEGIPEFQVKLENGEDESPASTRARIRTLWQETKESRFGDIFSDNEEITIDGVSLQMIVGELQEYSLLQTNRDVVGDAFEVFSERQFAGEKGQFFTPRGVVSMVVKMLNPQDNQMIIDPASGSGGFLIVTLNHIAEGKSADDKRDIARHCLYGVDKDMDLAKICKAHMTLIGDGSSNVVTANSLQGPENWGNEARGKLLSDEGEARLFDMVMTNPPFGSKIKVTDKGTLGLYELGYKWKQNKKNGIWRIGRETKPTPPQVLFIERCLRLLKPKGKMGIVLPDGLLGNTGDGYIRQWLIQQAKVLAVVDCPVATFMPHTGAKTSVLILQKRESPLRKISETEPPPFFAIAEHCGHTMRGREIMREGKLKEDFSLIAENYCCGDKGKEHFGFSPDRLTGNILVPRYYDPRIQKAIRDLSRRGDTDMKTIKELEESGMLEVSGVPASASSEDYDLDGDIRFIRTSDIAGYELSPNTQKMADMDTYLQFKEKQDLQIGDILFVKDGDHKIGETAILLDDSDLQVLVQTHFKKIRPLRMDPFLLLWLLNTPIVKKQIRQRVFSQSTLSTIGERIYELNLPLPKDGGRQKEIIAEVRKQVTGRRESFRKLMDIMSLS